MTPENRSRGRDRRQAHTSWRYNRRRLDTRPKQRRSSLCSSGFRDRCEACLQALRDSKQRSRRRRSSADVLGKCAACNRSRVDIRHSRRRGIPHERRTDPLRRRSGTRCSARYSWPCSIDWGGNRLSSCSRRVRKPRFACRQAQNRHKWHQIDNVVRRFPARTNTERGRRAGREKERSQCGTGRPANRALGSPRSAARYRRSRRQRGSVSWPRMSPACTSDSRHRRSRRRSGTAVRRNRSR
jgi:hypothetical protein